MNPARAILYVSSTTTEAIKDNRLRGRATTSTSSGGASSTGDWPWTWSQPIHGLWGIDVTNRMNRLMPPGSSQQ